jgi:alpha-mannosidase
MSHRNSLRIARVAISLVLAATDSAAQTQAPVASRLKEIIVVYKTHFDIGYTALTREVVERYRTSMIDKALDLADESRGLPPEQRFAWTIPGWPLTQILWDGQTPERRKRVLEALRTGQFVNHALPFTTHTESLDIEDLVRGMGFSSRLARGLSLELPRDAKMTDVPCHSWIVPTMLKQAGIEFLHLGSNSMSNGPELPSFGVQEQIAPGRVSDRRQALFWWEGPDGSRVLTMYSRSYGSGLVPPPDWPYSTWLALIHTGDNSGPPTSESVQKVLEEARTTLPGVKVRFGRLSDFADALLKENPKLPVVRGDMPDPWIYGLMSMPIETALIRNTRPQIGSLEALNTLLGIWTGQADAAATIAAAYEQSLLYSEHTWGYDAKKFPRTYGAQWEADRAASKFQRLEESWGEHREYSRRAADLAAPELKLNLKALSAAVRVEGKRIAVFNSLPWPRGGVVEAEFDGPPPRALRDAESGARVPVEADGGTLRFIAQNVPPLGYRTYMFVDRAGSAKSGLAADEEARTIENQFFRITFDPVAGRIVSVLDKSSGRELVDARADFGFAQYVHEQFSAADMERFVKTYTKGTGPSNWGDFGKPNMPPVAERPHRTASPRNLTLRITRGAISASAVMDAEKSDTVPYRTALAVTLYDGQPYVDVGWRVIAKAATPAPEGGWLSFALNIVDPRFRLARLGSVIDPAKETVSGSNHDVYCLTGGVAVLDSKQRGVGLCPLDSPLVSLDHPGLWQYTKQFASKEPRVFVNLYNNLWGTNFAQWSEGSWTSRVRLWSFQNYKSFDALVRPSQEVRAPLRGVLADGPGGKLPPSRSGLRLSRVGVALTAFGKNPDGPGLVLRLWEQAGGNGSAEVCLPEGMSTNSVQPVDLRGRALGDPVSVRNGCFTVGLRHYSPVSFVLQ